MSLDEITEIGEIWKPINGFEDSYLISNYGNVYSIRNQMKLKPSMNEKGYLRVCLQKNGKKSWERIHRLVATAFIPNYNNKPTVNHINHCRDDNRVSNLEWATMQEQSSDPHRTSIVSEKLKNTKHINEKKRKVRRIDKNNEVVVFDSIHEAARQSNVTFQSIWMCCNSWKKSCGEYVFQYV